MKVQVDESSGLQPASERAAAREFAGETYIAREFERNIRMEARLRIGHPEDMMTAEQCWNAVARRDRSLDGTFFFGVLTTGVYCRPSCPARRPLRRNVRFYPSAAAAEGDGLRPCLRCHPSSGAAPDRAKIDDLCRFIEAHSDETLTLERLADRAGLSRFHLQRTFKAATGLTPKQYANACRLESLKRALRDSKDVTEAVYAAGFGSSSRVYESAGTRLGMTPNRFRQGGRGISITHATVQTPVGLLMIAATDRGVCFVQFGETREALLETLRKEYPESDLAAMREPATPEFGRWMEALKSYLAGQQTGIDLPLELRATAFQMRVWNYLQSIPYGEVRSYAEVAAAIDAPSAARAVARACAGNRVALAIPCHRVIRGDGDVGGYRWGLSRKRILLEMERGKVRT